MKKRRSNCLAAAAGMLLCLLAPGAARALTIQFNYDYDTLGFFDPAVNPYAAQARATLENAGRNYEMFTDSLSAIMPGGVNTWSANFTSPASNSSVYLPGLVVPADTIIVFVGGRNMGSLVLGSGGPGGFNAGGTGEWRDLVKSRGQGGALLSPQRDFGPWGGSISFNSAIDWNYDLTRAPAGSGQHDFFSVCLHELAHVLGFGSCGSWDNLVNWSDQTFTGDASAALHGGPVPLANDAHWDYGTQSFTGGQVKEAAMSPALTTGTRKRLTTLDVAALDDLGWQMPAAGDANLDGIVDAADYVTLKGNLGKSVSATWADGDFDFDGAVTWRDLGVLEANFGGGSPAGPAQVPEPIALGLLALGSLAALRRKR